MLSAPPTTFHRRKSPSTLAGDAKRSHARRAGCSVHEAEGELASSVKPQTTFYAAKNTVTVTQEQVKAGSVTPRQMELAKACREAEWIPYNPLCVFLSLLCVSPSRSALH